MVLNLTREAPPKKAGRGRPVSRENRQIRSALLDSPGTWIRVADGLKQRTAHHRATQMRNGLGHWDGLKIEARVVNMGDSGWTYYARLLGSE